MTRGMIMEKCSGRGSCGGSGAPFWGQWGKWVGLTHLSAIDGGWRLEFVIFNTFALC